MVECLLTISTSAPPTSPLHGLCLFCQIRGLDGVKWDSTQPTQVHPVILTPLLGARVQKPRPPQADVEQGKVQVILRNPNPDLRVSELVTQRHNLDLGSRLRENEALSHV